MNTQSKTKSYLKLILGLIAIGTVIGFFYLESVDSKDIVLVSSDKNKKPISAVAEPANKTKNAMKASSSAIGKPVSERDTHVEENKKVKLLDTEQLIAEYRDWSDEQIKEEIKLLEDEVDSARYLERANQQQLDDDEYQKFSDLLLTIDSLIHVRTERQLAQLEQLVESRPRQGQ